MMDPCSKGRADCGSAVSPAGDRQGAASYQWALQNGGGPKPSRGLSRFIAGLIFCIVAFSPNRSSAETVYCLICDKLLVYCNIWTFQKTNYICADCIKIKNRCSLCALPVKSGFFKSTDDRYICRRCLPNSIVTQEDAKQLFEETRRQLYDITYRTLLLKNDIVEVRTYDVDYWSAVNGGSGAGKIHQLGFSSTSYSENSMSHNVILLNGQLRSDVAGTCAHEYTHLWINENKPKSRKIEQNTIEGICELIAYKLAVSKNDTHLQAKIKRNGYTKGRALELIELEHRIGLQEILDWVKSGTTTTLDKDSFGQLAKSPTAPVTPLPTFEVKTPDKLVLSGILKSGGKRTAIINRQLFAAGDENTVRVGNKTVTVHCLEIQANTVVITVDDSHDRITLQLQ